MYRKRAVTWPFIFYTIIWTLSLFIWDTRTVILFIFLYFVIQEVIFFIIDKKDHNKNDKLS
ncbi:hypothetical protein CV735_03610 [Listeria monocytogenes]|nr:hypothetical protein CV735_03610 [Listeria monocytogenes]